MESLSKSVIFWALLQCFAKTTKCFFFFSAQQKFWRWSSMLAQRRLEYYYITAMHCHQSTMHIPQNCYMVFTRKVSSKITQRVAACDPSLLEPPARGFTTWIRRESSLLRHLLFLLRFLFLLLLLHCCDDERRASFGARRDLVAA